jgi:hypothetical protein
VRVCVVPGAYGRAHYRLVSEISGF